MVGLKLSWNLRTRMPTRFAARKCPSSCTNTSTPSTNTNDRTYVAYVSTKPSDLQFYPAGQLQRILTGPLIHFAHTCKRVDLDRHVRVHRVFDDTRDRR